MRKLATVRKISEIRPIQNADAIELAIVDGWQAVVRKGEYSAGDWVVYCEIDSFLPIKPEYEFLRKSCYRKLADGTEGFRIKTMKLRGQLSQGLVLPIATEEWVSPGQDVTEQLEITKYEPTLPMQGTSTAKAPFPSFIPKTDEERIQNLIARLPELKSRLWTVTEKLDGTSFTCYSHEGDFGVCSRNWELNKEESSVYWQIANRYNLKEKLAGYNLAIQGEILAPGIQGNKYKVEQPDLYVFNVYMINDGKYMYPLEARNFCDKLGLKFVPLLDQTLRFQCDVDFLLQIAEGKSKLNPAIEREGLVYVTDDGGDRISFKVISNKFLLKED